MLRIRKHVADQMTALAKEGAPLEVCGYLGEKGGVIEALFPITNTDASADHYSMDPVGQFEAIRKIRDQKLTLRAAYHSHPASPARPSAEDIRLAYDANISYLILSLMNPQPDLKGFLIRGSQVTPEEIQIV